MSFCAPWLLVSAGPLDIEIGLRIAAPQRHAKGPRFPFGAGFSLVPVSVSQATA